MVMLVSPLARPCSLGLSVQEGPFHNLQSEQEPSSYQRIHSSTRFRFSEAGQEKHYQLGSERCCYQQIPPSPWPFVQPRAGLESFHLGPRTFGLRHQQGQISQEQELQSPGHQV